MARHTNRPTDDEIIKFLIDNLGKPGFSPQEIAFLMQNPNFAHMPVGIREFITSEQYLNSKEDCWPGVMNDLVDIFSEPVNSLKLSPYSDVIRKMGFGSGKSFRIVFSFCYVAYRLGCLVDPSRAYGLASGSVIALVNAAITSPQAKKIIFGDIKERIRNSPWFQQHMQPDPNVQSELRFPKNIVIFPGSSSETAPLGYNIFLFNIDEAAFFPVTDSRDSAQEIYETAKRRIKSRFGDYGLVSAISSPSYVDSFIERRCEESKTDQKVSSREGPTWENKPSDVAAINAGDCFEIEHPPRSVQATRTITSFFNSRSFSLTSAQTSKSMSGAGVDNFRLMTISRNQHQAVEIGIVTMAAAFISGSPALT